MLRQCSIRLFQGLSKSYQVPTGGRGIKQTTGLVGLEVDPEARATLIASLHKVKDLVAGLIPGDTEYRKIVEQTCDYKLNIISQISDDKELEEALGFQLEEEIVLCQDELGLIPRMAGRNTCIAYWIEY